MFAAVHEAKCSVIMISQASSEHSICFAVMSARAEEAKAAVETAFYKEIKHDRCMKVCVTSDCSIVCAVGERMCGTLGVLGQLATALADAEVNVKAVSQGSSELNITFVVDTTHATRALAAMHEKIYGDVSRTTSEGVSSIMEESSGFASEVCRMCPTYFRLFPIFCCGLTSFICGLNTFFHQSFYLQASCTPGAASSKTPDTKSLYKVRVEEQCGQMNSFNEGAAAAFRIVVFVAFLPMKKKVEQLVISALQHMSVEHNSSRTVGCGSRTHG
eukprot:284819296_4